MSESNTQRLYLTCGSMFLLIFSFTSGIAIIQLGAGAQVEVFAVIALVISMAILVFNSTLLFGSNGGPRVLATGKTLLWLSFLLIVAAIIFCLMSMIGSL